MDFKKKNFLENLRLKTKLPNLKVLGKKKQGKKLAYRRSISVPDLRIDQSEAPNPLRAGRPVSDAVFLGTSHGQSDTDSFAESLDTDSQTDSAPSTCRRASTDNTAETFLSIPPGKTETIYEEIEDVRDSGSESNLALEMYAKVNKRANIPRGSVPILLNNPVPAPRTVVTNTQLYVRPKSAADREIVSTETVCNPREAKRPRPSSLIEVLARASSFGEQGIIHSENKSVLTDQSRPCSEKGTPPALRANARAARWSLVSGSLGAPGDSADGISLDSGSPSEEQVNMPWTTDSEELERESCPLMDEIFSMDEAQLEQLQLNEAQEETFELSSEPSVPIDNLMQDLSENSDPTSAGSEALAPVPFQRYLLNINLKEGKNLVIRDKRTGTSDPYVKFKLEGKQFYKSKVMYKNLNPRWNESFSHPLRDREHNVELRVYDKNRTSDDFMGSSYITLKSLELYKTYETELHLDDPKSKEKDMGVVLIDVCLMFRDATIKRSPRWAAKKNKVQAVAPSTRPGELQKNQLRNQMWTAVLSTTLVEGQDLPQQGYGDIYVRFRLGDQKYKSKNLCIQANPQWREQFDFNHFEENQEPLQVEVFSKRGRKGEESWGMFEIDPARLPVNEKQFYTNVLNPDKGRLVLVVTVKPCWGVSVNDLNTAPLEQPEERDTILEKFSLKNSHKSVGEVGFLQVKVIKAADLPTTDLNGKSNPFCVVELGNSKLQTQTVYKTLSPEWNVIFTFPVKDIHDVLELTVLDEQRDKSPTFLGKVAVQLLSVENGKQVSFFLKKEDLGNQSKGTITLVVDVVYNKVRAGIKTFQPQEAKFTDENLKFSKKVLARNIYRVRKISTAVLYTLQYIKSCFQWESTQRSLIAFLIFLVTVWHGELFMLPLFLLLLIGWSYFQLYSGKTSSNQDLVNMSMADDEEEDEKESGKKGLMDKIHMVQEVVLTVQNVLDEIANIGERIKNLFNWSVPFLSCLTCMVLFTATALLYFIPLRYIVLIWGVNKFTKKLRNPYTIDNNEILDFLKRVPSDVQKVQYSALRAPTSQSQQRRKR
ncbi:multiple C2 and transmembrane domain-containing protein 2 [Genypterus blacodes]|uniref:multiple C2 and transmembrane domain-containing protein 2 n=1 Tax=Genypterus blacodes TaxID=154954 RepID=UPI003F7655F7